MSKRRPDIISRGPEIVPRPGTRHREMYDNGWRGYESVLPGQRFPEGAGQKELDRLADVRAAELAAEAAQVAVVHAAAAELPPQPEAETGQPAAREALAA
jgi:hypothetical protein